MNSRLRWRIPDERVDLAGEQIDHDQQAERAMAFVLQNRAKLAWHRHRQSGAVTRRPGFQASHQDRDRLLRFLRLGSGFFQDLDSR